MHLKLYFNCEISHKTLEDITPGCLNFHQINRSVGQQYILGTLVIWTMHHSILTITVEHWSERFIFFVPPWGAYCVSGVCRRQHRQWRTSEGNWGFWTERTAWAMLREREASSRRTADDSAEFGWKTTLRHNITIQRLGQSVLSWPR